MKSLLITGGNGYLGSVLTRRALSRGYRVFVLDRAPGVPAVGPPHPIELAGDVCEPRDWQQVLRKVDAVVHLAAVVGDAACDLRPDVAWETNHLATVRLAEACRRYGVARLVLASTCSTYGASAVPADLWSPVDPRSLYSRTKTLAEHHLLSVRGPQLDPCVLRFATLYGPSPRMRFDLVVNRMTAAAVQDGVIEVHGGSQWRPFLHVRDAAGAILAALTARSTQAVLNCGATAENYRIIDIARLVEDEVAGAELVYQEGGGDRRDYRVDFAPIRWELDFRPRLTVRDGVRELAAALREGRYQHYRSARYHNHLAVSAA